MKYFPFNGKPSPYVKNFFALAMVIGLLGWPMVASADPISFSDTHYYVSAYATNGGTPEQTLVQEGSQPPVEVHLDAYLYLTPGGDAIIPNNSKLYADARGVFDGQAVASAQSTYDFTASFPQIRISFDYEISAISNYGMTGSAYAGGQIFCSLYDTTWSRMIFQFSDGVDVEGNNNGSTAAGQITRLTSLIEGHDYELILGIPSVYMRESFASASAYAWLDNIDLEAVPLPGTLLLLGSGLLGLAGWRRFRKG